MQLNKEYLIMLVFIFYLVKNSSSDNTTEKFEIIVPEKPQIPSQNKTIDKLVQEQTDLIKKIVSTHKATTIDYPIVTRKDAEVKEDPKMKEEKERQSIEELRRKCQEFFKINQNNTQKITERSETKEKISTVEAFGPNGKPEFLQKPKIGNLKTPTLPSNFSYPSQVEQIPKRYFIMTRNRTTENQTIPRPQSLISQTQIVQNPLHQNIKYVQLEPIILQKMILNNGRMLYYWYRNIPVIPQYVPIPKYQAQSLRGTDIDPNFKYPSQMGNTLTYQAQTSNTQIDPYQVSNVQPDFQITPQILNSSQYQNSHPLPNNQNFQPQPPIHPQTEVVPNYEIEYTTTEKSDDNFKKQMKFVIPVPYPKSEVTEGTGRYPWQFDPYAYYPRSLQPSTINVPLPYLPTFHMIRTIRIPDHLTKMGFENN